MAPLGAFGWTGGFGTWCEADPEDGAFYCIYAESFSCINGNVHGQIQCGSLWHN